MDASLAEGSEPTGVLAGRGWADRKRSKCSPLGVEAGSGADVSEVQRAVDGASSGPIARAGDLIIIQERYDSVSHIVLSERGELHNRYGRFCHADVIGKRLGLRWMSAGPGGGASKRRTNRGFIYALAPTPALWSMALHHRTQVVYPHDSAIISLFLDLRPGSVLVESGTGAGSASVSFARTVAPHGKVVSFEFHSERARAAEADFAALGLSDVVRVHAGHDVLGAGFSPVGDGAADAVFLDLPAPYSVIGEAARVLRPDGALCTFSPCIEQVQRTCAELGARPFHSVRTVTAPTRTYEARPVRREAPGFDEVREGVPGGSAVVGGRAGDGGEDGTGRAVKRRKRVAPKSVVSERAAIFEDLALEEGGNKEYPVSEAEVLGRVLRAPVPVHARPFAEMKGHTSYLTFARRSRDGMEDRNSGLAGKGGVDGGMSCAIQ